MCLRGDILRVDILKLDSTHSLGSKGEQLCSLFRENMNLILRQMKPSFWGKTLMRKKKKKMSGHGKDSYSMTLNGKIGLLHVVT